MLEGATELTIFPRVMDFFGIRREEGFIAVQDAGGAGRDLTPLVAYAVAPRLGSGDHSDFLPLTRPPTRLLVVMDAENSMATAEAREGKRKGWVERMLLSLSNEYRNEEVRAALDRLVEVGTWDRKGESFEFAHFTDRQLVSATARLDRRPQPLGLDKRAEIVANLRAAGGNLDVLLGGASKVRLAEELRPVCLRRG